MQVLDVSADMLASPLTNREGVIYTYESPRHLHLEVGASKPCACGHASRCIPFTGVKNPLMVTVGISLVQDQWSM